MNPTFKKTKRASVSVVLISFISLSLSLPVNAQTLQLEMPRMPKPGVRMHLSPEFTPALLRGISVHPDNALQFDFLIHKGDKFLEGESKKAEYKKLVKYFLASLTIPDEDQWVNLSPYEKDRIIKDDFGKTEMGRDLLAEDYVLKQITSSLMYPEEGLGKEFWNKIYQRAWQEYHTTTVLVSTFNKVWIVPDQALVYESGSSAYILKSHLKVMLEEDYLSLAKHTAISAQPQSNKAHTLASQLVRTIILPALEIEVNEGKNFATLRQMYSGMVLATWYKKELKDSLLGQYYADKAKVKGVDQDPKTNQRIYAQYLKAFRKGVFNYIKEDMDKYTNTIIPRKYFSGGFRRVNRAMLGFTHFASELTVIKDLRKIAPSDLATLAQEIKDQTELARIDLATIASEKENKLTALLEVLSDQTKKANVIEELRQYLQESISKANFEYAHLPGLVDTFFDQEFSVKTWNDLGINGAFLVNGDNNVTLLGVPIINKVDSKYVLNIKAVPLLVTAVKKRVFYLVHNLKADKEGFLVQTIEKKAYDFITRFKENNLGLKAALEEYIRVHKNDLTPDQLETFVDDFFKAEKIIVFGSNDKNAKFESKTTERQDAATYETWLGVKIFGVGASGRTPVGLMFPEIQNNIVSRVEARYLNSQNIQRQVHAFINDPDIENKVSLILRIGIHGFSNLATFQTSVEQNLSKTFGIDIPLGELVQNAEDQILRIDNGSKIIYLGVPIIAKSSDQYGVIKKSVPSLVLKLKARIAHAYGVDSAMANKTKVSANPKVSTTDLGGIDFNAAHLDLHLIKRDGKGMVLPLMRQDKAQLARIEGFFPEIIAITPAVDAPILKELGQKIETTATPVV